MDFALGLKEYSKHDVEILSLPAKNWKWRMRGAAIEFARQLNSISIDSFDLIFASDMMNLADFKSLAKTQDLPIILYFHENQITYPLSPGQKRDWQFGYTNITSALSASKVFFNSRFQFNEFISKIDELLKNIPDLKPDWIKDEIIKKSSVLYPGCRFSESTIEFDQPNLKQPLIIWNHRWEWDKNPAGFFEALNEVKKRNIPFELALLGEQAGKTPNIFKKAEKQFSDEIIAFGYIESKNEYLSLLQKGDIVVSTSIQENFGISVVEAVRMGCIPLLPNRLSYPEIMPKEYLNEILYSNKKELAQKLENLLLNHQEYLDFKTKVSSHMDNYSWKTQIVKYDSEFEQIVEISK